MNRTFAVTPTLEQIPAPAAGPCPSVASYRPVEIFARDIPLATFDSAPVPPSIAQSPILYHQAYKQYLDYRFGARRNEPIAKREQMLATFAMNVYQTLADTLDYIPLEIRQERDAKIRRERELRNHPPGE